MSEATRFVCAAPTSAPGAYYGVSENNSRSDP